LIAAEHAGPANARNLALAQAKGQLVAILDADDYLTAASLGVRTTVLQAHDDISLVGSNALLVGPDGEFAGRTTYGELDHRQCSELLEGLVNPLPHSSWMVRASVLRELGGYETFFAPAEDYEFLLRAIERHRVHCLKGELIALRKTETSISHTSDFEQIRFGIVGLVCHQIRAGYLGHQSWSKEEIFAAVNKWFKTEKITDKFAAQQNAAFAKRYLTSGQWAQAFRSIANAFVQDPAFAINRHKLRRLRENPLSFLKPYLA
jgi:glycosyltransferase involved in cell wall biosynthesis